MKHFFYVGHGRLSLVICCDEIEHAQADKLAVFIIHLLVSGRIGVQ